MSAGATYGYCGAETSVMHSSRMEIIKFPLYMTHFVRFDWIGFWKLFWGKNGEMNG